MIDDTATKKYTVILPEELAEAEAERKEIERRHAELAQKHDPLRKVG